MEILRLEYGSRAHGTSTENSDHDVMSIFVEDRRYITGIETIGTETMSTAPNGERSGREDTDVVSYPLNKFATLAAAGNPTVLTAFFAKEYITQTAAGSLLISQRSRFISKEAGRRYRGYMLSQLAAFTGMKNKKTNRPELIHKYGYDSKFAYHLVRLGIQGIELMNTGRLELPLEESVACELIAIRNGVPSKDDILKTAAVLDHDLQKAIDSSKLPSRADIYRINEVLHEIYTDTWRDE